MPENRPINYVVECPEYECLKEVPVEDGTKTGGDWHFVCPDGHEFDIPDFQLFDPEDR